MKINKICIDKEFISSNKNILFYSNFNKFELKDEIPNDCWIVSNTVSKQKNINELARLNGSFLSTNPPQKYIDLFQELGVNDLSKINWKHSMKQEDYKIWIANLQNSSRDIFLNSNKEYYENIFLQMKTPFLNLEKAKINKTLWKKYSSQEKNSTQFSVLKSFEQNKDGYSKICEYDLLKTMTGRISVKNGPQILTLKKKYRNMIESRFGSNGKIVMLDFVSLEPRLASIFAEQNPKEDVYTDISNSLFDGKLPRNITKFFVLPLLYGMTSKNLKKKLKLCYSTQNYNNKWNIDDIVDKIYEYFKIKNLTETLVRILHTQGFIESNFGRPIFAPKDISPYVLINYLIQSSAVEISLLGFGSIVDYINEHKLNIKPIFIIHDAILLDVHKDYLNRIEDLKEIGSQIKEMKNFKFYLKEEEI